MIQLIARNNIQGYYADVILKRMCDINKGEVVTSFLDKFHIGNEKEYDIGASVVIIFGFPYSNNQEKSATELREIYDNPFSSLYHFCSFGDTIPESYGIHSFVDEVVSPLKLMMDNIGKYKDADLFHFQTKDRYDLGTYQIMQALDNYHRYTWVDQNSYNLSNTLNLLGKTYASNLFNVIGSKDLKTIFKENYYLINSMLMEQTYYINKKLSQVTRGQIDYTQICLVYAEQYVNEIAHTIINSLKQEGHTRIIVLIGKHTKGEDMFQVRTEGVNAKDFAYKLNRGKGKERVANVFLGNSREIMLQGIKNVLNGRLDL